MAKKTFHYLPPDTLDAFRNVELIARGLVEGALTGLHRSPYNGFSSEFSEYRKYCPGDAVRFVDWLAYAKTDRYYVKQFHEETNTRCYVLLDCSGSMGFGEGRLRKFHYCCYCAAAMCYLMQRQHDAVGLATYAETVHDYFPAKSSQGHLRRLLRHLETVRPAGRSAAGPCFHRIAEAIPRRSMVMVFSDFFDADPELVRSLEHFRYNRNEVLLFQVLDRLELEFPYEGLAEFRDLETGEIVEVECEDFRGVYLDSLERYNRELKATTGRMNVHLEVLSTASPFEKALLAVLHKRQRLY